MGCEIIDNATGYLKESVIEKITELKPYIEALTAAAVIEDYEIINDQTYILVNLMLEIHSRMKALGVLDDSRENFVCE